MVDGLTKKDAIAFPTDSLEEGEKTEVGDLAQTMSGGADGITDMDADYGNMDDAQINSTDMDPAQTALQSRIWRKIPQTQQMTVQKI